MKKSIPSIKIAILILVIAILVLPSCKKHSSENPRIAVSDYIKYSTVGMQYVKMPLNAYYIYKDSATGILDSVVVTKSSIEKKFSPAHVDSVAFYGPPTLYNIPDHYYEEFSLNLTKFTGSSQQEWISVKADNAYYELSLFTSIDSSIFLDNKSNPGYAYQIFQYPLPYGSGNEILSSITVEGKMYTDILRYSWDDGGNYNKPIKRYNYYWAKGVGIIKRVEVTATSTTVWTLLRKG